MRKTDLDERLIRFSISLAKMGSEFSGTRVGSYLSGQLVRSAISVSLNYAEAQSSESRKDFLHKMKIVLKELRECYASQRIALGCDLIEAKSIQNLLTENNELISIFVKSISTARKNNECREKR